MRNQHKYVDLSDLNARYDQMAIQGLGGGSLGDKSALGTTTPSYPWGQYSYATVLLQERVNTALLNNGDAPINMDGSLGPSTCGAIQAVLPGEMPATCEAYILPVSASQNQSGPVYTIPRVDIVADVPTPDEPEPADYEYELVVSPLQVGVGILGVFTGSMLLMFGAYGIWTYLKPDEGGA